MLNQPNLTDFRKAYSIDGWTDSNPVAQIEDEGGPIQMDARLHATRSGLSARWVICAQSGALIMQWREV